MINMNVSEQNQEISLENTITESEIREEKIPRMFPLRLGFMSFMFITFFFISVLILNVSQLLGFLGITGDDLYTQIIDWIRETIGIANLPILVEIYDFLVPTENEALYISADFVLSFYTIMLISIRKGNSETLFSGGKLKRILLQIIAFFFFFIVYMQLLIRITDFIPELGPTTLPLISLILGATIWLFFQGLSLFTASLRSGTNVEASLTKKGGRAAFGFAFIAPLLVLIYIIGLAYGYNILIDFIENNPFYIVDANYDLWRDLVLYFTIIVGVIILLSSLIAQASRKRRQKTFDNMILTMTIFFMYPYILFNFTIYFVLPKGGVSGGGGDELIGQILLLADLIVTLTLLLLALRTAGKRTGYRFGKLNKHSFIMFIYASLAGQFGIRYLQTTEQLTGDLGVIGFLLDGQYLIINAVVGLALIITLFMFGSNRFGRFIRVRGEISRAEQKQVNFMHSYLIEELVRTEAPILVANIYDDLANVMRIEKFRAMQLLEKTNRRFEDIKIEGIKKRYVIFAKNN